MDELDDGYASPWGANFQQRQTALADALKRLQQPQGQQPQAMPQPMAPPPASASLLFSMGQNPTTQSFGREAVQAEHQQQQLQAQAQERALNRQLSYQRAGERERHDLAIEGGAGKGGAVLDPATVIHLRPDVTEALGGEESVMAMDPRSLGAAVHAFDTKQGQDYKNKALGTRTAAQATRTDALSRSVAIREKKLGLDVGGRNVPGAEMGDGMVLQPKEAAFGKNLRGNVQKAQGYLQALRQDFNKYGPETLSTLGGTLPNAALSRMEGNRARLLEAALQLQGMNPTIGHQALLEQQLRDPNSFKNLNRDAYNAQLDELGKSLNDVEQQWAAGHGVKRLAPLQQPTRPGAPAASEGADTIDVISPEGKHGRIPAANLEKALARGFKRG